MSEAEAVLLAADDHATLALVPESLGRKGYRVVVARTSAAARARLRDGDIGLVLLDLSSPGSETRALLDEARAQASPPEFIVITAEAMLESAIAAAEQGMAGYVTKPVDPARLDSIAARVFERRRLQRENARLQREVGERLAETETLLRIAREVNATLDLREALRRICRELVRLTGADTAAAYVLESGALRPLAAYHVPKEYLATLAAAALPLEGQGFGAALWRERRPVHSDAVASDPRFSHELFRAFSHQSGLLLPLAFEDAVVGAFYVVWWRERRRFAPRELALLEGISEQVGLLVRNARLFGDADRNRQRLEALNEVARRLGSVHESGEVVSLIVNEACRLLGAEAAGVRILDGNELVAAARTASAEAIMARERIRVGESLSGWVVAHDEVLILEDLAADTRHDPAHKAAAVALGYASFVGAPLRAAGRTIGVINVFTRARRRFTPDEIALLSAFADQAALAIEKARLFAQAQQHAAEAETLAGISETLASTLDIDRLLEGVLDGALRIVGADRAVVYRLDESGTTLRARAVRGAGTAPGFSVKVGHAVVGSAVARRAPVAYADVQAQPLPGADEFYAEHGTTLAEAIRGQAYRGILAAPLIAGDSVFGAICVYWSGVHEATPPEIRLLTAVARQAAVALDSARLYAEAQTQRTRLAQIFESTSDGIVLVGRDGAVQATNRRAGELVGFDADRAVGLPFTDLIVGDARAFAGLRAALADPQRRGEGDLDLKPITRIIHWVAQPTIDAAKITIGFTLTLQDVTQERLASQMKSDFVSFVTHQLRTPLSGIKWMLELAAEAPERVDETAAYVRDAREAAERLISLVNDMLDASRLESGRLALALEDVDLARLTQDVLDEIAPLVRDKGHDVSVEGAGRSVTARGDAQLLRQVVLNLASNAIKYTPQGGRVTVCVGAGPDGVEWAITDSGIGIPKEAQRRLFEKFFRADNVFAVETEGTGLGLYLVRLIVEKHGGRVWCESEEGRGSTFAFRLPARAPVGEEEGR